MRAAMLTISLPLVFASFTASAQATGAPAGDAGLWGHWLNAIFLVALAFWFGRLLAKFLPDDQRRITVGAVVAVIGAALTIYGIASINSTSSQIASRMGNPDVTGMIAIGAGVFLAVLGFVTLASRVQSSQKRQAIATKKCAFCAETILAEAKLCRFCGKNVESASA